MSMKHRKFIIKLLLMPFSILASASAIAAVNGKPAPLIIQEQGSFSVGGTVITNPGTFGDYIHNCSSSYLCFRKGCP